MNIEYTSIIDDKTANIIEEELEKYDIKNEVACNYTPFGFIAEENGNFIGAVTGYTCFAEVYIDDLVVKEEYRGKGIGKKLLKEVENYYKGKKFNNMNLVTNGFQAPKFYEKCGFQLEFVRENKDNPKFTKYFYVKFF